MSPKAMKQPDPMRWQPLAKQLLPEIWSELWLQEESNPGGSDSLMCLFFTLLPAVKAAHRAVNDEFLLRAYAFADWSIRQPEHELSNPAAVAFYEHIFDDLPAAKVVQWVGPRVLADIESLLEFRLGHERTREIKREFAKRSSAKNEKLASVLANAEKFQ